MMKNKKARSLRLSQKTEMDYETYREKYFVEPRPTQRFNFYNLTGATLYFQDYEQAVNFYKQVLGPPGYIEGDSTKGWMIGNTRLTLLSGKRGNPQNVEIQIVMKSPDDAEKLQRAFIEAGGTGPSPSNQIMYEPIRSCPVKDPFGTDLLIISYI